MNMYIIDEKIRESELEAILALNRSTFEPLFSDVYAEYVKEFKENIAQGRTLIARLADEVVGFAGYIQLKDSPDQRKNLEKSLIWASDKANKPALLEHMEKAREDMNWGEAVVEIYDHAFTPEKLSPDDIYFTELVVKEGHRGVWNG